MGLIKSKLGNPDNRKNLKHKKINTPNQQVNDYEDPELRLLKRTIVRAPERFILNNLMMCIQFFENFEEDMNRIKETLASPYEEKLNKTLPSSKHVLLPDVLQKYIARNIDFTSKRQTGDLIIEPLQAIRMYIVHDNIEVTEQNYLPEYSSLNNGVTYSMMVQPIENQPGYVRLRCLYETPYIRNLNKEENINPSSTTDSTYDGDDELYGQNTNTKLPKQIKKNDRPDYSKFNAKSSPILQDDETIYEDQAYISRGNVYGSRTISDTQHRSSSATKESDYAIRQTWSKNEFRERDYQSRSGGNFDKSTTVLGIAGSLSSGYHSDSSNYLYGSRTICDTQHRLSSATEKSDYAIRQTTTDMLKKVYSNANIPSDCFKEVRINSEGKIYSREEKYSRPQNSKQYRLMMADRQYDSNVLFMSSKMFMNYFVHFFVDQLAEPLGFKQDDLNFVENSVIHCYKILESHSPRRRRIDSYEITPTIWLQWPECAQEWLDRPRSTWPDENDVNKVKDFGCHIIPEDSLPKENNLPSRRSKEDRTIKKNIYQEIEWQLAFPAAERYLETCMTRSQVHVYLIALMLHKTFLRPVQEKINGLTTNHIRNRLFWLIEENDRPSLWPDNRTGDCLIKLLKSLYDCIGQSEPILPDYFVCNKNMFQKMPKDYLLHSQKQLKRIIDNPVMYVFNALENIKHSDQFFPKLNLKRLLEILTKPKLAVMIPALSIQVPTQRKPTEREEYYNKTAGLWGQTKKSPQIYSRVNANRTVITHATDNIVEISKKCEDLEGPRLAALLEFFVRHFIKMADCCNRYRAYPQKKVYLDQADRLSIILSEQNDRYVEDAKAYREKIEAMKKRVATNSTMRLQNKPPKTPERNVLKPIFVGNLKDRFVQDVADVHANPSENEQPHSSRENYADNKIAKVAEVRFQDNEENAKSINATAGFYDKDSHTENPVSMEDQSDEDQYGRNPMPMRSKSDDDLYPRRSISKNQDNEIPYRKNTISKSNEDLYPKRPVSKDQDNENPYRRSPTSMGKSNEDLYTGNSISTDPSDESASGISIAQKVISLTDNLTETTYI